jgi:hypothetical protein
MNVNTFENNIIYVKAAKVPQYFYFVYLFS